MGEMWKLGDVDSEQRVPSCIASPWAWHNVGFMWVLVIAPERLNFGAPGRHPFLKGLLD